MGGISKTGNVTHDANVLAAEGTRQVAVMNASTQAAATTAELAYWRTRRASAIANNMQAELAQCQQALLNLGTNGV